MIVIFLGPPGAGKGTQAAITAARHDIPQLSTGDMLRAAIAAGSDVGQRAKSIIDAGELVSDDVVAGIVSERIDMQDCEAGFLLDGFPRTIEQAHMLDRMLTEKRRDLTAVIELQVDEERLVERLNARVAEAKAKGEPVRSDDNETTFRNRLGVYRDQTAPLIPHYQSKGLLRHVDGMQAIEAVSSEIERVLTQA